MRIFYIISKPSMKIQAWNKFCHRYLLNKDNDWGGVASPYWCDFDGLFTGSRTRNHRGHSRAAKHTTRAPCRAQAGDLGIVVNVGLERARQACRPSMRVCMRTQRKALRRHAAMHPAIAAMGCQQALWRGVGCRGQAVGEWFHLPQQQDRSRPIVRSWGFAVSGSAPACLAVAIGVQHGCECTTALLCWKSQSQYPASWVHESA